jgi:flagellar hook assembly protein FlgD
LPRSPERELLGAGEHAFAWNGSSDAGTRAPAGVYFVILETEDLGQVHKFVLSR